MLPRHSTYSTFIDSGIAPDTRLIHNTHTKVSLSKPSRAPSQAQTLASDERVSPHVLPHKAAALPSEIPRENQSISKLALQVTPLPDRHTLTPSSPPSHTRKTPCRTHTNIQSHLRFHIKDFVLLNPLPHSHSSTPPNGSLENYTPTITVHVHVASILSRTSTHSSNHHRTQQPTHTVSQTRFLCPTCPSCNT